MIVITKKSDITRTNLQFTKVFAFALINSVTCDLASHRYQVLMTLLIKENGSARWLIVLSGRSKSSASQLARIGEGPPFLQARKVS